MTVHAARGAAGGDHVGTKPLRSRGVQPDSESAPASEADGASGTDVESTATSAGHESPLPASRELSADSVAEHAHDVTAAILSTKWSHARMHHDSA